MEPTPIATTRLHLLSELLDLRAPSAHKWPEADLRAMLEHLLSAPLPLALGVRPGHVEPLLNGASLPPAFTLGDLYDHPAPPAALLRLVKDLAKSGANDPCSSLPADLLLLIYYAAVALARVRGVAGVSTIKAEPLERGMAWGAGLSWATPKFRSLFQTALQMR
jgi:hypothetical protein